jgi:hypothetical protein
MIATRGHMLAPNPGIECVICPFDLRIFHFFIPHIVENATKYPLTSISILVYNFIFASERNRLGREATYITLAKNQYPQPSAIEIAV